jgi:hypothetical protein
MVKSHGDMFKPIVELVIDSRLVVDGSVVEYMDRVFKFSHREGVDLNVTLSLGLSQKEGGGLIEFFTSIFGGLKMNERNSHVYMLLTTLHGLFLVPRAWYFKDGWDLWSCISL